MDNKNLSKIKYIYKIYKSGDGIIHCEKKPVPYINKEFTYYVESKNRLNYFHTSGLVEEITREKILKTVSGYCRIYTADDNVENIDFKDINNNVDILKKQEEINQLYSRERRIKNELDNIQRKIEILNNKIEGKATKKG